MKSKMTLAIGLIICLLGNSGSSQTVKIGAQKWMTKDLDVTTFTNGTLIPEAKSLEEWGKAGETKSPAWCYYGFDSKNSAKGRFYNWYVVNNSAGIAPKGYHIPSREEFQVLLKFLDPASQYSASELAGLELKSTEGWIKGNNGNNKTGFNAIPIGFTSKGEFVSNETLPDYTFSTIWSSSRQNEDKVFSLFLMKDAGILASTPLSLGSIRCLKNETYEDIVEDRDLRSANEFVTINKQKWQSTNLNVTTFRNGDRIPEAKTKEEWIKAGEKKEPAWCYYDNDTLNGIKYGKLYNLYAVIDKRGLAPKGWHIPSIDEWTNLIEYLGNDELAGGKLKSRTGWKYCENCISTTNEVLFSGLPSGYRLQDGLFYSGGTTLLQSSSWWSNSEIGVNIWSIFISSEHDKLLKSGSHIMRGNAVRCIKN